MSATNKTTYYEFPVFVGSDKPAWLVDWNGAMNAIDSAIHEAKAEADANATNIASLQSDVTSLAGSVNSQGSSITSLTQSLTSLQGTVNTITSLIGNGLPTTDDKTIIGAINELNGKIEALDPSGDGVQAENVSYDNTDSSLTATNVQDAIDELKSNIDNIQPSSEDITIVAPETKIGTFLGKDLYRKVVSANNPSPGNAIDSVLTSAYVDDLVSVNGYIDINGDKAPITFANTPSGAGAGTSSISVMVATQGLNFYVQGVTATKAVVIVEYTKA